MIVWHIKNSKCFWCDGYLVLDLPKNYVGHRVYHCIKCKVINYARTGIEDQELAIYN